MCLLLDSAGVFVTGTATCLECSYQLGKNMGKYAIELFGISSLIIVVWKYAVLMNVKFEGTRICLVSLD